eukprot:INCI903.1.p1 GENE.INCI903.1~~INCI903.1.p1  ORF type:complete len:178 (+),score=23.96 INCI903.1:55-588(+)
MAQNAPVWTQQWRRSGMLRWSTVGLLLLVLLASIAQATLLRSRVATRNLLNTRLAAEPKLFLPPKQFLDSKMRVVPFESPMPKASLTEGDALKNKRYFLHYDYSQIFDRRALEGSNALLSMWPHNPARAGADASKERVSFMNFPDSAIKSASALSHSIFNDVASLRPLQDPPPLWGL